MEATGVYWVILYEILEEAGIDVLFISTEKYTDISVQKYTNLI